MVSKKGLFYCDRPKPQNHRFRTIRYKSPFVSSVYLFVCGRDKKNSRLEAAYLRINAFAAMALWAIKYGAGLRPLLSFVHMGETRASHAALRLFAATFGFGPGFLTNNIFKKN